jgi:hypothetical protein
MNFYLGVVLSTYEFIATYEKWRIIYAIQEGWFEFMSFFKGFEVKKLSQCFVVYLS